MVSQEQKGNLLVVDDERVFLKLMNLYFQNHFNVKTAISGFEALDIINSGFTPGVILSDQMMPMMNGTEFLEKTIEIVPDAIRIIITAHSNPSDIIACINQAHAHMFLKKPVEELALVQAIKLCFRTYDSRQRKRNMLAELNQAVALMNENNDKMKKLLLSKNVFFDQLVNTLTGICLAEERFYFKSNLLSVRELSLAIANEMELSHPQIKAVEILSVLQSAVFLGMPEKFILYDPQDISDEDEALAYYEYFHHRINSFAKVEILKHFSKMLVTIFEYADGSGFFNKLQSVDIPKPSQIVSIAKFYHNGVYRMKPESLELLKRVGEITQTKGETRLRHNEVVKSLYKNVKKFDHDVFYVLHDLIKNRSNPSVIPIDDNLTIRYCESGYSLDFVSENVSDNKPVEKDKKSLDTLSISLDGSSDANKMIEKEIPIEEIEGGMTIGQNLVTKSGLMVVRQDTRISAELARQIKQLYNTGMLSGYVTILVPSA